MIDKNILMFYKVSKGTSFIEFYYQGLSFNTSFELQAYIEANKWHFNKMTEEVKNQFRQLWKALKNREEEENELYR